jgi:uncharacterized RDD family membrane protein YckC
VTTPNNPPPQEPGREPTNPWGQPPPAPGPYGPPPLAPGPYGQPPPTSGWSGQPPAASPYGQSVPPTGYGVPRTPVPQIASMGDRLLARIIDFVLLAVVGIVLAIPVGAALAGSTDPATGQPSDAAVAAAVIFLICYVLITVAYEVVLIAVRGQTVGKQVMKLTVRREADGAIPGWGPSMLRWLVPVGAGIVTACIGGIGQLLVYLSPFFDGTGRNQGWHDKVAKTLVVKG